MSGHSPREIRVMRQPISRGEHHTMLILDYGRQIYAVIDRYPHLFYETATVVWRMSRVFKLYDTKGEMSYDSARFCSKA